MAYLSGRSIARYLCILQQADEVELSEPSTTRSEERSLAERLLAKHMHEEHHSTLTVSILEARGLSPRQGALSQLQQLVKHWLISID